MDKKEFRKPTKLEFETRVKECTEKIITEHLNYTMFCDWFQDHYELTKHSAHKYWVRCWEIIKSRYALETDQLINKQLYQLYDLFKEAKEIGDFGTSTFTGPSACSLYSSYLVCFLSGFLSRFQCSPCQLLWELLLWPAVPWRLY